MGMGIEINPLAAQGSASPDEFASISPRTKWRFRGRSLGNLFRMGHCAPTVMRTIQQIYRFDEDWPVKLAAGLPGGIGDTGFECGGITSPLILMGLRFGLDGPENDVPLVFYKGHALFKGFLERNGKPFCREIRGDNYRLRKCIKAVCCAPEIALTAAAREGHDAIAGEPLEAYRRLYSYMQTTGFHCSQEVLRRLSPAIPLRPEILDATAAFLGGTLLKGMTCSALVAGVMALGFRIREFEDSVPRVMRMIVLMKTGGHAFDDHINKFNVIMNLGNRLAQRFAGEFGDTQCRTITGCDFSSVADVAQYIETDGVSRCRAISRKVADEVLGMTFD
jgi:C_GCAxxG_C_C family probable redox protein